jgi:DNA-binding transcriptional LysR family regulator
MVTMSLTQSLHIFIRVADSGNLSAAARSLDLTPAAVSASIKRLEAEIGALLFVRTTRQLRLTQAGERFLLHAREGIQAIERGVAAVQAPVRNLEGPLRMSMPSDLSRSFVLDWLDQFVERHPGVRLQLDISDRLADVFRQPVDVALRYGHPSDSSMVALPIAPSNRRVLCAAPTYLARRGAPLNPSDLAQHDCLSFMLGHRFHDEWSFKRGDESVRIAVTRHRTASDGEIVHRWALDGHGIAYKSALDVHSSLRSGRLVALCTDWRGEDAPLFLLCPQRREITPMLSALRTFLSMRCKELEVA